MILAYLVLWILVILVVIVAICVVVTWAVKARVEAALPPIGRVIDVNGAAIRYLDEGAGPPIVLVHGLAGQMRHWTYAMVDRLKSDFRVVVFDRPGYGYSTVAPGATALLSNQARTIVAFIRGLDLDQRPLLVGHSLGGALSLAVALDHRETIAGLALIAPLTHTVAEPPSVFRLLATLSPLRRWLTSWVLATPLSLIGGKAALAQVFGPDPVDADFAIKGGNLLGLRPASFAAASAEMSVSNDDLVLMEARYANLDCPVGILFGTDDQILDPTHHGRRLADKVPGATIEYIAGGHMPPQVQPDRTARFIRDMAARAGLRQSVVSPPDASSRK